MTFETASSMWFTMLLNDVVVPDAVLHFAKQAVSLFLPIRWGFPSRQTVRMSVFFSFFLLFFLLPAASFSNGWNILMAPSVLFPSPVVFNQQPQISYTMDGSPSSFRTCRLRMIFSPGHDARCLPLLLRLWPSILHNKCGVNYLWLTYFITCSRRIQSNRVGFGFHTVVYKGTPTNASSRGEMKDKKKKKTERLKLETDKAFYSIVIRILRFSIYSLTIIRSSDLTFSRFPHKSRRKLFGSRHFSAAQD